MYVTSLLQKKDTSRSDTRTIDSWEAGKRKNLGRRDDIVVKYVLQLNNKTSDA
jgi:hypothetical protein